MAGPGCGKQGPALRRTWGHSEGVRLGGEGVHLQIAGPDLSVPWLTAKEVSGFADQRDRVPRPPGRSYGSNTCVLMEARGWPPALPGDAAGVGGRAG